MDRPLFIQLGELLKGGLQDRTVATDLVLDPGEKYDGVQSYCVERARWSKRQAEDHTKFIPSHEFVSTKFLRKSVERRADQAEIRGNDRHRRSVRMLSNWQFAESNGPVTYVLGR